ncbi:MAG TPA: hypothetical protein DCM87_21620 [Planctomycetes bacterium]|nr:hypothetical protein [Planctomycetota bacterium]
MSLSGNLKSFSLAEIFQSLALNRHSGTLCIRIPEGDAHTTRYIHFAQGEITFASSASPKGYMLGEILVRQGKLTEAQINEALAVQRTTGEKLGETLIGRGLVTNDDIAATLQAQLREEIHDLFLVKEAEFEFKVDAEPPPEARGALRSINLSIDPQPLILEGLKRLDEWPIIQTHIRTGNEIFAPTGVQPELLDGEEREVYALIDGRTPVGDLYQRTTIGRFPCARTIFNLITAGFIRPLSVEELLKLADESADREKARYLAYALQQQPADVALRIRTSRTLHELEDDKAACEILREGLNEMLPLAPADQQKIAHELLSLRPTDKQALHAAVDTAIALNQTIDALNRALDLTDLLKRQNDPRAAREVLLQVNERVPDDPDLRLAIVSRWRSIGDAKAAMPHMEFLAALLTSQKNWTELVKILRWMMDADPSRQEIRARINKISTELVAEERTRSRRKIVTVSIAAAAALAVIIPFIYERKARVAFAWIANKEYELLRNNSFQQAEELYQGFFATYGWSSWNDEAEQRLTHLRNMRTSYDARVAEERAAERERIARLTEEPARLHAEGVRCEEAGDLAGAYERLHRLIVEFPHSPLARNATLPLRVTSIPAGADVYVWKGDEDTEFGKKSMLDRLGSTPLLLRYRPGRTFKLVLKRAGCRDAAWSLAKDTTYEARVRLQWAPLAKISHGGPVHGQALIQGGDAIFSARDGGLYRLDPSGPAIKWRRAMGRYGDPPSWIAAHDRHLVAGNAEGELSCLDPETGEAVWRARLPGAAYLLPARGPNGTIYAATTNGRVLGVRGGTTTAQVALDGRIASGPVLIAGKLVVGTSCDLCYGLDPAKLAVAWRRALDADIVASPVALGATAVVATAQGWLYGIDAATGAVLWRHKLPSGVSSRPLATDRELCVPLDNGEVHLFGLDGAARAVGTTGGGPIGLMTAVGRTLFFGNDAGACIAFDLDKAAVTWSYAGPAPVEAAPFTLRERIFFATIKGDIFVMEILP